MTEIRRIQSTDPFTLRRAKTIKEGQLIELDPNEGTKRYQLISNSAESNGGSDKISPPLGRYRQPKQKLGFPAVRQAKQKLGFPAAQLIRQKLGFPAVNQAKQKLGFPAVKQVKQKLGFPAVNQAKQKLGFPAVRQPKQKLGFPAVRQAKQKLGFPAAKLIKGYYPITRRKLGKSEVSSIRARNATELSPIAKSSKWMANLKVGRPAIMRSHDPHSKQNRSEGTTENWSLSSDGLVLFKKRIYIPPAATLKQVLLELHHDDPLAGHFGERRTSELLKMNFHWERIDQEVKDYVKGCAICQSVASPRHRPYGKLNSLLIPSRPWSELTMDFITGLPQTYFKGSIVDSILVIVDRYTKMALFFAVSITITSDQLAELFHNEVELKYGAPDGIVSDRGTVFTSKFWSNLCYLSHVKSRLSTAFHPQTDGQTERTNQVLEHYLRCFTDTEQTNWPTLLRTAEFACNKAVNSTTKLSPFNALMGYQPEFHIRAEVSAKEKEVPEAEARITKMRAIREKLENQWRIATESHQKQYNKKHKNMSFKRGDLISLSTKNLRLKVPAKKLAPRFIGPFRILNPIGQQAYRIALPEKYDKIHNVFHVSLLEPWVNRKQEQSDSMPFPPLEDEDDWEVEEVKEKKKIDGEDHFLLKWKGWPSEYNQWVQKSSINAPALIRKFEKTRKRQ
jgi:transposase InsO family protein